MTAFAQLSLQGLYTKWSLETQLRTGFAAGVFLILGACGAAWWVALSYESEIKNAYETQLRTTVHLAEAHSAFWRLRLGLRRFMSEGTDEQQRIVEQQAKWYSVIEERLAQYQATADSEEEKRAATSLRSVYLRYKQTQPKFFESWQAGDKDQALAWLSFAVAPFGTQVEQAFERQIALQYSFAEAAKNKGERDAGLALVFTSTFTIVLIAMFALAYLCGTWTLRPIRALRTQAEATVREQLGEIIHAPTENNEVSALVKSFQLMSERLLARIESLRESREQLAFLLGATPAIIYSAKPHGNYATTFVSANIRAELGYEPDELTADPAFWTGNIHPDDCERVLGGLATLEKQDAHADEYRFRHKDGSWRWIYDETRLMRDASGTPKELVGYRIDVTSRVIAEEDKKNAEHRLQLALEGGRIAMWDADAESGKVWLSEQWAEMLGEAKRETWTSVMNLIALVHPDDRQRLRDAVVAVMKGERAEYSEEHRVRTAGGEWIWLLSRGLTTERKADGRAVRMSGTNLDITRRKQAETELRRVADQLTATNRALDQANRMKTDFMANVTHELRTPLNSVIGFAELLHSEVPGPLNTKQAQFAADILASGERLLALVEGMLEISRLDSAAPTLEREQVELGAVLEERVAAHRRKLGKQGMTIELDVEPHTGKAKLAHHSLRRILDALLDNAIKFNRESGSVTVRARHTNGALEISVADTGIGIAREDLCKVFQPLVQLDAGLARRRGGIGLGLTLATRFAQLQGGTIEVKSEPGKGSEFTLRFPEQD